MVDPLRPTTRQVLYLSGPISPNAMGDTPEFCSVAINIAIALRRRGWSVFCPHSNPIIEGWTLDDYMREDEEILSRCCALVMLPFWEHSVGAKREKAFADRRGIPSWDYRAFLPDWKG